MPVPLEPGDRKILISAAIALFVLVVLALKFAPAPQQESSGIPSTYSTDGGGAKAAFLLLQELGFSVERWNQPPTALPGNASHATLILAMPTFPASSDEVNAIHQFALRGGTVLGIGGLAATILPQGHADDYAEPGTAWKTFRPVAPSPLSNGVNEIVMAPTRRWKGQNPEQVDVFADGDDAVVVTYAYGEGRIIWWAAATPLANAGILRSGNLNLFLNSIGASEGRTIFWDEYFHGERGTIWRYFAGTPIPWGLVQCAVVGLALFLTFGRRSGPVRAPLVESRLAPLEFVETLGDLYHRAHAGSSAVGIEFQRFRYLLARRLGTPVSASIQQLHDAVRERLGWKEPGFFETLQRAERGEQDPALDDKEALRIAQALEQYEDVWKLRSPKSREKNAWRNK